MAALATVPVASTRLETSSSQVAARRGLLRRVCRGDTRPTMLRLMAERANALHLAHTRVGGTERTCRIRYLPLSEAYRVS